LAVRPGVANDTLRTETTLISTILAERHVTRGCTEPIRKQFESLVAFQTVVCVVTKLTGLIVLAYWHTCPAVGCVAVQADATYITVTARSAVVNRAFVAAPLHHRVPLVTVNACAVKVELVAVIVRSGEASGAIRRQGVVRVAGRAGAAELV